MKNECEQLQVKYMEARLNLESLKNLVKQCEVNTCNHVDGDCITDEQVIAAIEWRNASSAAFIEKLATL